MHAHVHAHGGGGSEHCDACKGTGVRFSVWSAAQFGAAARLLELLSASPAAANKLDELRHAPLLFAAQHGHASCVRLLLEHGADAGERACGCTALHRAAFGGHSEAVALLLAAPAGRAALDARDASTGDLRTALGKAASQGHVAVVAQLLAAGADKQTVDAAGRRAVDLAREAGHDLVVALLSSVSSSPDPGGGGGDADDTLDST